MKKLILVVLMCLTVGSAEAKVYVCLDRSDGSPKGMVDIEETVIGNWAKSFVMIEADESYRGLSGAEIKFVGQKLRKATKAELDTYNTEQANKVKENMKKKAMEELGITEDDIAKIKALK